MAIVSFCPTCHRQLNIPDELVGQAVKCAECHTTFTAGSPDATAILQAPARNSFAAEPAIEPASNVIAARDAVVMPVVAMIVVATMNVVFGIIIAAISSAALRFNDAEVAEIQKNMVQDMERQQQPGQPGLPDQLRDPKGFRNLFMGVVRALILWGIISAVTGLLAVAAAVRALRLRSLGFAKFAFVLLMIPLTSPCWMVGILLGIWAIVTLNKPEVKAAVAPAW